MIIRSNFKDYYDYIEHINGGDPKVVYSRHRLNPLKDIGCYHMPVTIKLPFNLGRQLPHSYSSEFRDCLFKWCMVAGKLYLIVKEVPLRGPEKPWALVTPESGMMARICPPKDKRKFYNREVTPEWYYGFLTDTTVELCRMLNHPVFTFSNGWGYKDNDDMSYNRSRIQLVEVDSELPILKDLGFASIIPAEQMYQDIAYFMSNTIRNSPDNSPPVEIGNNDKIVGHGFDLQQSFRHRK